MRLLLTGLVRTNDLGSIHEADIVVVENAHATFGQRRAIVGKLDDSVLTALEGVRETFRGVGVLSFKRLLLGSLLWLLAMLLLLTNA